MSIETDEPKASVAKLLDFLKTEHGLKNDAALAREMKVAPPVISKLKSGNLPLGAKYLAIDSQGTEDGQRRGDRLPEVVDGLELHVQRGEVEAHERHFEHQAPLQEAPFGFRQHPRDDVERDQALGGFVVAVDREGDADAPEQQLGLAAAGVEMLRGRRVEPGLELAVGLANGSGTEPSALQARHLVERHSRHCLPP